MLTPVLIPLRRFAVLGAAAVGLAALRLPGRPHTICLLRATTGLPCPLCGGTTTAVDIGHGQLAQAFLTSPVAVLGALALVLAGFPFGQRVVAAWRALPPRSKLMLGAGVIAFSEVWQLVRFGLV